MRHFQSLLLLPALIFPCVSFGQVAEFGFSAGQSLLRNNELTRVDSTTAKLTDGFRFGFRVTLNTWRFLGHEMGYAYNRTQLRFESPDTPTQDFGMAIHQGFYNMLAYALPEGAKVRPFVAGGAHFSNYVPPGASVQSGGGSNKFGLNYGGGIKARVGSMFLIRFDIRQYHTPKPDFFAGPEPEGWLRQTEVSAGFALAL